MISVPTKVRDRLVSGVKKFQPILIKARDKDINESDTVTILTDVLSDVFGYDKYIEITSEHAIKKTFCDLAIKIDGTTRLLIEVKAAGLQLKDQHIRQALDYGSNSGTEWVILTNGLAWKVYKIIFAKPIDADLVYEFDLTEVNPKKQVDLELLYYLTKEAMGKSSKASLDDYHEQKQLLNRFTIGQILTTDAVLDSVRKVLKKMSPDAKISNEEIKQIITDEVIKRDVLDDEKTEAAKKKLAKALKPVEKTIAKKKEDTSPVE